MSSPSQICMNGLCGATTTQWKRGWPMKGGGFATLCYACGTAYENVRYCERFHLNEPGWRECNSCDKPVHCGCVVSKYLHECVDSGGILCIKCIRVKSNQPLKQTNVNEIPNPFARYSPNLRPSFFEKGKFTQSTEGLEKSQHMSSPSSIGLNEIPNPFARFSAIWNPSLFSSRTNDGTIFDKGKHKELTEGVEKHQHTSSTSSIGLQLPVAIVPDNNNPNLGLKATYEQSLGFALSSNGVLEGKVEEKVGLVKQEPKPRMKPSKSNKGKGLDDNRVARPPAEGRGRGQLLPRYWPKITDQELLQISGDLNSNCTVTPLFEKVLSASDAGRIGRLVLPKACAEAYFPRIDQSEGLPIKIRDIKGREWTFQFRFWPNNNSRMYVLEGVTPCMQNMQLQAGDTVIFSRLDPEDKLVIGCRKAPVSTEASPLPNTVNDGALISTGNENSPTNMEQEEIHEKKKARNIGPKSKRLHMHQEDAMELKFTWQEMQEFLRPPPSNKPTVTMIENCELEEYDEPPVFGKKTIFTTNASRLQEQWVQCDSCSKWRKLPSDVLIPSRWTCSDNASDPDRCSCSAPEEKGVGDLNRISRFGKESKKRKVTKSSGAEKPQVGPTGLDALATVAVSGANPNEAEPTTRHPRHRPGCTCIVCIQPPSGKGNHKPNCICTVCSTVRRRFKTLMLRKKKRLLEQGSDHAGKSAIPVVTGTESGDGVGTGVDVVGESSSNKGQNLDLNFNPKEEESMLAFSTKVSDLPPEWHDMLAKLVPSGTTDIKDEPMMTTNNVIEGS